jgi:hypothetical protein
LRATLRLLAKQTKQHRVSADDMKAVLAAGVTKQQIIDALNVSFCFNVIDRLADTFEFCVPDSFATSAKFLLSKRGYRT